MDVSNRTLAFFLVLSIFVTMLTTLTSISILNKLKMYSSIPFQGAATTTDTGQAEVTITSQVAISVYTNNGLADNIVNFGSGYVNSSPAGTQYCILDTNASTIGTYCVNSTSFSASEYFIVENTGNIDITTLNITSDKNASTFLGGTSPTFAWAAQDNEAGSCTAWGTNAQSWKNFTVSPTEQTICTNFLYADSSDTIRVDLYLAIPEDVSPGTKTATITFEATG